MQRVTILPKMRRFSGTAVLGGMLTLVVIIGTVLIALQGHITLETQRQRVGNAAVPKFQSRAFADERGYRASVVEYTGLGESYLPLAPATVWASSSRAATRRIFADEMGYTASVAEYAALGEDYRPLMTVAPRTTHRANVPRIFVDEALSGDTLITMASALSPWSNDITPVVGPR